MKLLNHPILQFIIVMALIFTLVVICIHRAERKPEAELKTTFSHDQPMFAGTGKNGEKYLIELGFRSDGVVVWRAVAKP